MTQRSLKKKLNPITCYIFTTNNRTLNILLHKIITKQACPAEVTQEIMGIPIVDRANIRDQQQKRPHIGKDLS